MSSSEGVKHIATEEPDDDLLSKVPHNQDMELVDIKSRDSDADALTDVKQETDVPDITVHFRDTNTKMSIVFPETQNDVDLSADKETKIYESTDTKNIIEDAEEQSAMDPNVKKTSLEHSESSIDDKPTPGGYLEKNPGVIKMASEESEDSMDNKDTQTDKNVIEMQPITAGGPTPGEKLTSDDEAKSELSPFSQPSDPDSEDDPFVFEDYQTKSIGDCAKLNSKRRRWCCIICNFFALATFVCCFIFYPHSVELCLRFSFEDWDIADKLSGEKGRYELRISNPNTLAVNIQGLEINAYYGNITEENGIINTNRTDYYIPGHSSYNLTNQTFKFTQDCTAVISPTTLNSCSKSYRAFVDFQLVSAYTGCVLEILCQSGIVFESTYESTCPEDEWVCTKLKVFSWDQI